VSVVAGAMLRANRRYELMTVERTTGAERVALGGEADEQLVLRPRCAGEVPPRAVTHDMARLFVALGEPAPLPGDARGRLGGDADRTIAGLILDGVLEIEHRGEFLSGARAGELLLAHHSAGGSGRIGELSRAALAYARTLVAGGMGVDTLAARLYSYGRVPVTASLCERFADDSALDVLLGIDGRRATRAVLDASWVELRSPGAPDHWRNWEARGARAPARPGCKLYVSPAGDAVRTAFKAVCGLPATRGAVAFKVGAGVDGLCRPDKLVVYFDELDDLLAAAATLAGELVGCPAQGVPFTAALTGDGLLSWGADPAGPVDRLEPCGPAGPSGLPGMSWRQWVTGRLAECLVQAGSETSEPVQFALGRLRLDGVDTDSWTPSTGLSAQAQAS
jgi:hypothetical protein